MRPHKDNWTIIRIWLPHYKSFSGERRHTYTLASFFSQTISLGGVGHVSVQFFCQDNAHYASHVPASTKPMIFQDKTRSLTDVEPYLVKSPEEDVTAHNLEIGGEEAPYELIFLYSLNTAKMLDVFNSLKSDIDAFNILNYNCSHFALQILKSGGLDELVDLSKFYNSSGQIGRAHV